MNHPLFERATTTIAQGDLDGLQHLLDRAPELVTERTPPPLNATLLHHTAFNGIDCTSHTAPPNTPDLARLLIERGANANAVAYGDPRCTSLCWALSSWFTHESRVMTRLADVYLEGGADIEGINDDGAPLGHAIGFGYTAAVEHLAGRGARTDHVFAAAALGDVDRLAGWWQGHHFAEKSLGFARGDKRESGRFSWPPPWDPDPAALALVTAATHGRTLTVRWLLDAGVPPDASVSFDQTAMHFAACMGHRPVVYLLLARGARVDIRERQFSRTAADWARETGELAIARHLEGRRA